jgi:hypothetical protein
MRTRLVATVQLANRAAVNHSRIGGRCGQKFVFETLVVRRTVGSGTCLPRACHWATSPARSSLYTIRTRGSAASGTRRQVHLRWAFSATWSRWLGAGESGRWRGEHCHGFAARAGRS